MAGTGIDLVLVRNPWGERWWIVQRYVLGWAQPIHMTHLSGGIQSSHFSQFLQLIPLALLFVFSSWIFFFCRRWIHGKRYVLETISESLIRIGSDTGRYWIILVNENRILNLISQGCETRKGKSTIYKTNPQSTDATEEGKGSTTGSTGRVTTVWTMVCE